MDRTAQRQPVWKQSGKPTAPRPRTITAFLRAQPLGWTAAAIVLILVMGIGVGVPSVAAKFTEADSAPLFAMAAIVLLLALIYVPRWQTRGVAISERFDKENEARKTLAQVVGGLAVLITLYSTNQTLSLSQQQLRVAYDGQVTERFTKAVDQLGATDTSGRARLEIRLGGIYALARIADDSPIDRSPIAEILTAYVRHNAPIPQASDDQDDPDTLASPSADIQSVFTVLGRRRWRSAEPAASVLNFSNSNLAGIGLAKGHMEGAVLLSVRLDRADLRNANLTGVNLFDSYLTAIRLDSADLTNADLRGAHMHNASLSGTKFVNAKLQRAELNHADVQGADFSGADLADADFTSVDLRMTHGLCREQILGIVRGRGTIIPKSLAPCAPVQRR
jgi:hypothetical protein